MTVARAATTNQPDPRDKNLAGLVGLPDGNGEGSAETSDHERPVSEEEEAGQRVEGDVGARALLVVVRATELGAGGREATAGDE